MSDEAHDHGERRHEQCRHGTFASQAYRVGADAVERPFAMPLCAFKATGPIPPAMRRAWGGAIEFARDCALCDAYSPLETQP